MKKLLITLSFVILGTVALVYLQFDRTNTGYIRDQAVPIKSTNQPVFDPATLPPPQVI